METMVLKREITKVQVPENSEVHEHRDNTVTIHLPSLGVSLFTTYLTKRYVCKTNLMKFSSPYSSHLDRLCGLVVRVSGYRYRGLGFDSRRYQIF